MRIIHISDLHFWHITLNPFRLAGKRLLGMSNLIFNRAWKFRMSTMPHIVRHVHDLSADHLLITGDLTTTALEEEFKAANKALEPLYDNRCSLTVIPGNHDRYTWRSAKTRLFEKYFGRFAPPGQYPWLREIDYQTAILGLDTARPNLISARGTITPRQLAQAQELLDITKSGIKRLVIACHYPVVIPHGIRESPGHRLEGAEILQAFLSRQMPHLYCHGHIHSSWTFLPECLPHTLCLNPGAALKKHGHAGADSRMFEIVLDGRDVVIRRHELKNGTWKAQTIIETQDFFNA
jgi:3',5'-cyclic AMP phosphodiesterase CpdA